MQNDRINLPKEITKNNRAHTFPTANIAQEILRPWTATGKSILFRVETKAFGDWVRAKIGLDKASGGTNWTLHDLRRTFASNLAALGIRLEVIEKLLNHQTGSFRGVAGIYNRYDFFPEMEAAIKLWEARLTTILQALPT